MEFSDIAVVRQSCRNYDTARAVEREKLEECLRVACLAPSARNRQPWHFTAVTDAAAARLAAALKTKGMARFVGLPPAFVVISSFSTEEGERWVPTDVGLTAMCLLSRAAELGLASCMLGYFDEEELRAACDIPGDKVRLVIALGYAAAEDPLSQKDRRPME